MTLAASAYHGVASSIGAWRREIRRQVRPARAAMVVAPLRAVARSLPPELLGDAMLAVCGDRLRDALTAPPADVVAPVVERTRRRMQPLSPREAVAGERDMIVNTSTRAARNWAARSEQRDAERSPSPRTTQPSREVAWQGAPREHDAEVHEAVPTEITPSSREPLVNTGTAVRRPRTVSAPLALALARLALAPAQPSAAQCQAPGASLTAPSSEQRTMRDAPERDDTTSARRWNTASAPDDRSRLDASTHDTSPATRQPWWTAGVDGIHSRSIVRPTAAPAPSPAPDAPEEAFAEMLADVLRQQAFQHGVLVP